MCSECFGNCGQHTSVVCDECFGNCGQHTSVVCSECFGNCGQHTSVVCSVRVEVVVVLVTVGHCWSLSAQVLW